MSDGERDMKQLGRRGGAKTRDTRGAEFYREIGKKGGARVKEMALADPERFRESGRRGGKTLVQERGGTYLSRIAEVGGSTTLKKYGREHYRRMARRGHELRAAEREKKARGE